MNYDLTIKDERKKFINRANALLKKQRNNVSLSDESDKTIKQNNYIHVLCRILACETGVTEAYAKQVYFKELANKNLFVRITKDALSGKMVQTIRSICDLTVPEMTKAISSFIKWAAEQGYTLPEATIDADGNVNFATEQDKEAFHQAVIKTSKHEKYL